MTRITIGNSYKVKPYWPVSAGKSRKSFIQLGAGRIETSIVAVVAEAVAVEVVVNRQTV